MLLKLPNIGDIIGAKPKPNLYFHYPLLQNKMGIITKIFKDKNNNFIFTVFVENNFANFDYENNRKWLILLN